MAKQGHLFPEFEQAHRDLLATKRAQQEGEALLFLEGKEETISFVTRIIRKNGPCGWWQMDKAIEDLAPKDDSIEARLSLVADLFQVAWALSMTGQFWRYTLGDEVCVFGLRGEHNKTAWMKENVAPEDQPSDDPEASEPSP